MYCLLGIIGFLLMVQTTYATTNPLSTPNNKFGVHIINATSDEASAAASLVNSSGGDWGYVTVTIQDNDRDHNKWQQFFNVLREKHLIPIVRLATHAQGDFWEMPYDKEEVAWADFLDSLNWPVKERYVIVYNEPNHAQEWGNTVDAKNYAKVLDETITALKNKNSDFFVLNAGLDASAPEKLPAYEDEQLFLQEMNQAVPGIFNKLDGWVSHSYPNPGFSGSPDDSGRGTVRTYQWELSVLKNLGLNKNLPVFITETGWQHAEGISYDPNLPSADEVATYYKDAFSNAWNDPDVVAVTPFLLDYQQAPFDHFSFEKPQNLTVQVLGAQFGQNTANAQETPFYPQYQTIASLPKEAGQPLQENQAQLIKGEIYNSLVENQQYTISFVFKNTGQSIWGENGPLKLVATQGGEELQIQIDNPSSSKIEPGQEQTFNLSLKAPSSGQYKVVLGLFNGSKQISTSSMEYNTEVKSPVVLVVKASLKWKDNFAGSYILSILSSVGQSARQIILGKEGTSQDIPASDLLPDYSFDFTLQKPYYQSKTIHQTVHSGVNTLDFGELQPDLGAMLLDPVAFWNLLPWSN